MKLKLTHPLKLWKINQSFGQNNLSWYKDIGLKGHNGIDFYAPDSTEVYATHDGRVTFAGYDDSAGLGVVIRTTEKFDYYRPDNGVFEPAYYKTIYWHLKKDTIKVTGGQTVKAGDLIALADNTGRSTGAHLHFGLKPIYRGEQDWRWYNAEPNNGYSGAIDPMPFFALESPKLTATLRFGDEGEQVLLLQKILGNLIIDGDFGLKTMARVKQFQELKGLVVDGIVGPKTREKLNI